MALDTNIPLSVNAMQAPDIAGAQEKALTMANTVQQSQVNSMKLSAMQQEADDAAATTRAVRDLTPEEAADPAKVRAKALSYGASQKSALSLQGVFLDNDVAAQKKQMQSLDIVEKMKTNWDKANPESKQHLEDMVGTTNNILGEGLTTYTTGVKNGLSPKDAGAAAKVIETTHLTNVVKELSDKFNDPNTPPEVKKALQTQIGMYTQRLQGIANKPFDLEETQNAAEMGSDFQTHIKTQKEKAEADLAGTKAKDQPAKDKAEIDEKKSATAKNYAEVNKIKSESDTGANDSGPVRAVKVALTELSGIQKFTPKQQLEVNKTIGALLNKYPDAKPDDVAAMIQHGADSAQGRKVQERVINNRIAATTVAEHALFDSGGIAEQVKTAAKAVDMGKFKSLNELGLYVDSHVNDAKVITLNNAIQAYKQELIQVMQRGGATTEGANERADNVISAAFGKDGINASIEQGKREVASMKKAGKEALSEIGGSQGTTPGTTQGGGNADPLGIR